MLQCPHHNLKTLRDFVISGLETPHPTAFCFQIGKELVALLGQKPEFFLEDRHGRIAIALCEGLLQMSFKFTKRCIQPLQCIWFFHALAPPH